MTKPIGVLGAGSFGTAISRLLSKNNEVLIYSRREEVIRGINENHRIKDYKLLPSIKASSDISEIGRSCDLIFPILPSEHFRTAIRSLAPYVGPGHLMIHGTKGLDVAPEFESASDIKTIKKTVFTMSEVIRQETSVIRTGALAGPNLATELLAGQPAATVIASEFDEIIDIGRKVLSSNNFIVYGSYNLKGIELAGALKNIMAIASGIMNELGFGKNMEALLLTRGLREMIHIAKAVGAEIKAFLGTAGVGDLIATATSSKSRNYTFGNLLAQGNSIDEILDKMDEVAEGFRTIKFAYKIVTAAQLEAPITKTLYKIVYEGYSVKKALLELVNNPLKVDVDFI